MCPARLLWDQTPRRLYGGPIKTFSTSDQGFYEGSVRTGRVPVFAPHPRRSRMGADDRSETPLPLVEDVVGDGGECVG